MRLISCSLFLITGVTASCGTQPAGNHLDALPSGASITKCDKKYTKCTYTCDGNYELYDSKNEKKLSKSQLFCKKDIWKTSSALLCREKEVPSCHQPELIFSDKYLKHKKTWMLVENGADQFSIYNFQIHTGEYINVDCLEGDVSLTLVDSQCNKANDDFDMPVLFDESWCEVEAPEPTAVEESESTPIIEESESTIIEESEPTIIEESESTIIEESESTRPEVSNCFDPSTFYSTPPYAPGCENIWNNNNYCENLCNYPGVSQEVINDRCNVVEGECYWKDTNERGFYCHESSFDGVIQFCAHYEDCMVGYDKDSQNLSICQVNTENPPRKEVSDCFDPTNFYPDPPYAPGCENIWDNDDYCNNLCNYPGVPNDVISARCDVIEGECVYKSTNQFGFFCHENVGEGIIQFCGHYSACKVDVEDGTCVVNEGYVEPEGLVSPSESESENEPTETLTESSSESTVSEESTVINWPTYPHHRWTPDDYCLNNPDSDYWCSGANNQKYDYDSYVPGAFCRSIKTWQECVSYKPCIFGTFLGGQTYCRPSNSGYKQYNGDMFCAYSKSNYFCNHNTASGTWTYKFGEKDGRFCQYMGGEDLSMCTQFYVCESVGDGGNSWPNCRPASDVYPVDDIKVIEPPKLIPGQVDLSLNNRLPDFRADSNSPTTSGFSSGAYSSTLLHSIYSERIFGIALTGGGPAYWNEYSAIHANLAQNDKVDNPLFMKQSRVFIQHGINDDVVNISEGYKAKEFYEKYVGLVEGQNLKTVFDMNALHVYPSNKYGLVDNDCNVRGSPWAVNNCNYDMSTDMITFLYPDLDKSIQVSKTPNASKNLAKLKEFSQEEFCQLSAKNCLEIHMSSTGYYYAPPNCYRNNSNCKVHMSIHGCTLSHENVGTGYMERIGMIEVADAYDIIMIFPHNKFDRPEDNLAYGDDLGGCWNTHGYLGVKDYRTRDNPQMKALFGMLLRAMGEM